MSLKYLFSTLISASLLVAPSFALAAPQSGALIKASGASVYYFGENQKRYVFPTEKTYTSWYADFSGVSTISDSELASYPLGGNVTYRPGTRLVKVTTDPRVYAISRGGTLRWVQTEALAQSLFGPNWATRVDDVPDAFFTNYRIGDPIAVSGDYSVAAELQNTLTINQDKALVASTSPTPIPVPPIPVPVTPAPTSTQATTTYTGTFTLSTSTLAAGEIVQLQASAAPSAGLNNIKLIFDGVPQKTCGYSPCATDVMIPTSQTKTSYEVRAELSWITGQTFVSTSTVTIHQAGSPYITLTISRPELRANATREIIADVSSNFSARFIDIYVDGNNVRSCADNQQCRYSATETSPVSTTHTVYAVITDRNGSTQRSANQTLRVVENDHPLLTITPGKNGLRLNETIDVTVSAVDDDGIQSSSIWLDGQLLKQCSTVTCTVVAGPWSEARELTFVGRATDMLGLDSQKSSSLISVQ